MLATRQNYAEDDNLLAGIETAREGRRVSVSELIQMALEELCDQPLKEMPTH